MKSTAFLPSRRLLQIPSSEPPSSSAAAVAAADGSTTFNPSSPFDSSMALTILVLLTALFFMGFFSVYIRRFTAPAEDSSSPPSRRASAALQSHKRGLDPAAVSSLPLSTYDKAIRHPMIDDCTICLGEFRAGETVKVIPFCGHVFHPRCVDTWLASHITCPLCRSAQLFKAVEEVQLEVKETAGEKDTCGVESSGGVRRACSCTELADRTVLQRSTSF